MAIDGSRGVHHDDWRSRVPDNDGRRRSNHDHWRGLADHDNRRRLANHDRRGGVTMHRRPAYLSAVVVVMNAPGNQCRNGGQTSQRNQSRDIHMLFIALAFWPIVPRFETDRTRIRSALRGTQHARCQWLD